MKKYFVFTAVIVVALSLIVGYQKIPIIKRFADKYFLGETKEKIVPEYNIVIVLDGTDRKAQEHSIPIASLSDIKNFVGKIKENGKGRLWLTFIDDNMDNNPIAYFEMLHTSPEKPEKKRSETNAQYIKRCEDYKKDEIDFDSNYNINIAAFLEEAEKIISAAYSNKVATKNPGSDIYGAINSATRILKTIPDGVNTKKVIVLLSDGVDNIGKALNEVPPDVKILLINNSGSRTKLKNETAVIELDNLARMESYIFN